MIQKSGDYYVFEDGNLVDKNNQDIDSRNQISSVTLQATGNIK